MFLWSFFFDFKHMIIWVMWYVQGKLKLVFSFIPYSLPLRLKITVEVRLDLSFGDVLSSQPLQCM